MENIPSINNGAQVTFTLDAQCLNLSIVKNGETISNLPLIFSSLTETAIYESLLIAAQEFMLFHLPIQNLKISVAPQIVNCQNAAVLNAVTNVALVITFTNDFIKNLALKIAQQKINLAENKNTLILNIDSHEHLVQIFKQAEKRNPEDYIYRNMSSGFDVLTRTWQRPTDFISPEEMIKFIFDNNISRIITSNMKYLTPTLTLYRIYMLAIFRFANVQFIMIDWDFYGLGETGLLKKAAFNCKTFPRYSAFPCHEGHWDKILGLSNIIEYPQSSHMTNSVSIEPLVDNYSVLIAANSRINNFGNLKNLAATLASFELTTPDNLFHDYQIWYHCISYYLKNYFDATVQRKNTLNTELMKIYFRGISLLKFEAIAAINTSREIAIFGDDLWGLIFPDYYQKKYLSKEELIGLWSSRRYLHIHVNEHFSYPEPNPIIMDALSYGAAYVGFPPAIKIAEQSGFEVLEYHSTAHLNHLIEDINPKLVNPEFLQSANLHAFKMHQAWHDFVNNIIEKKTVVDSDFSNYRQQHRVLFNSIAEQYVQKYSVSLKTFLNAINNNDSFELTSSSLFQRDYVQKICQYYRES